MISVAPLLIWAWLTGDSALQAEQQTEQKSEKKIDQSIEKTPKPKTIKTPMTREQAFNVLVNYGFQPQIPTIKLYPKAVLEVQTAKNGVSKRINITNKENKKPVILHFWATWCGPCRKEMPHFAKFVRSQDTFNVFTITSELRNAHPDEFVKIWDFYEKQHLSGINVCADSSGKLAEFLNISGIPVTFILSADGTIYGRFLGATDWTNQEFTEALISYMEKS